MYEISSVLDSISDSMEAKSAGSWSSGAIGGGMMSCNNCLWSWCVLSRKEGERSKTKEESRAED